MESDKFTMLEHTADIKFLIRGSALNEIFENSVLAFSSYISSGESKLSAKKGKIINVQGRDINSLLYNFLDELIYLLDAENFAAVRAEVLIRGNNLRAEVYGDDTSSHHLTHVKAATYAEMSVKKTKRGWEAQFVLDV